MSELRYCPNCCQNVTTVSGIDHAAMAILLIAGVLPGMFYYVAFAEEQCPMCRTRVRDLRPPKESDY